MREKYTVVDEGACALVTEPAPTHNVLDKERERERERERDRERPREKESVREILYLSYEDQPPESESTGPLSVGLTQYVCVCVCIL